MVKKWQFLIILSVFSLQLLGFAVAEFKPKYSPDEKSALIKFRQLISEVISSDSMNTDEYLIRWIRDAEFDLEKANQKLRKSMEWKKSFKPDAADIQKLNETLPMYLGGYDRTGGPIYLLPFGNWGLRKMTVAGKRPAVNRHMVSLMELGVKHTDKLRQEGQDATQWILVVDLVSFNFREHLCLACLPFYLEFMSDYENNYPETCKHMVAINAPKIFERVLDIGRPIMSPGTRKGLRIFSYNKAEWEDWFLSIATHESLVTRLGGSQDRF